MDDNTNNILLFAVHIYKIVEQILTEENEVPEKIQSDEGTEFASIKCELAAKYKFKLFHTYNRETKAVHAERFMQTLKLIIRRVLTTFGSYNYTRNTCMQ